MVGFYFFTALCLSGCSLFTEVDETATWSAKDFSYSAQKQMSNGDWSGAILTYQKMQGRFPYGREAEQALLDLAYAHYKNKEPELAVAATERFIQMHPTHKNVDYAFYLKGLSLFNPRDSLLDKITGSNPVNHDMTPIRDALIAYRELVNRFPDSKYSKDAGDKIIYVNNVLAANEVEVARFYYSMNAFVASVNRARGVLEEYQDSPATEHALAIMIKSYEKMGLNELRDDAFRVLSLNYPKSEYLENGSQN